MSAIKNFFQKRKADAKFKLAGPGHKLAQESTPTKSAAGPSKPAQQARTPPSKSVIMSGVAAIERIEKSQQKQPSMANRSTKLIRAEALKELEEERLRNASPAKKEITIEESSHFSVSGVYFHCPLVGPDVLPKDQMALRIKEFLYEQLEEERGLTSVLIIHTCNKDKTLVQACIETLTRCLNNIIENPFEEKYRKIRVNTKTFQEKIKLVEGALDFMLAAGFQLMTLSHNNEGEEEFYVMSENDAQNIDILEMLRDALGSAEPIRPELDRSVRVLQPAALMEKFDLPPAFYNISVEELKREQQLKSEESEQNLMLKTKAMRQREAERELRKYRFCLIRVRFPDDIILQGTFKAWETLTNLREFITEHLSSDIPFQLITGTGHRLTENDSTLAALGLAPAAVVNFSCDFDNSSASGPIVKSFLKPETLALLTDA